MNHRSAVDCTGWLKKSKLLTQYNSLLFLSHPVYVCICYMYVYVFGILAQYIFFLCSLHIVANKGI